jgi:hypothetical protein
MISYFFELHVYRASTQELVWVETGVARLLQPIRSDSDFEAFRCGYAMSTYKRLQDGEGDNFPDWAQEIMTAHPMRSFLWRIEVLNPVCWPGLDGRAVDGYGPA